MEHCLSLSVALESLKEVRDCDMQDTRNLLQAARANAVGALLVFLYLLKRYAQRIT
jgi:hypothetical protein